MKDYEIEVKVRNNYMLTKMRQAGYYNVLQLANAMGERPSYGHLSGFVTLKKSGKNSSGEWRPLVSRVADFLKCMPEDLFPPQHIENPLKKNRSLMEVSVAELADFLTSFQTQTPEEKMIEDETKNALNESINELSDREKEIIVKHYGLEDGHETTLREIGKSLKHCFRDNDGLSVERTRQIEFRAFRNLKSALKKRGIRKMP